jgi:thiamine kinase-like enzyme
MPSETSPRFAADIPAHPRGEVEELLRRWLEADDYATCAVSILAGGAVNRNFLVLHDDGRRSVLRLAPPPPKARTLGVDMVNSIRVAKLAGEAGAGPVVLGSREPEGDSLIEFLEGMLDVSKIHRPETIAAIGAALRKVHELPTEEVRAKTAFEDIDDWLEGARSQGLYPTEKMATIAPRLEEVREIVTGIEGSCVCHRDLNPQNCAWKGGEAHIIDWDFSAVDTPYLDLAMLIDYAELDRDEAAIFVTATIGEPTPADLARIAVMQFVNSVREWSWSLNAAAPLEGHTNALTEYLPGGGEGFDNFYVGYATVNRERAESILNDPGFEATCRAAAAATPAPYLR